MTDSTLPSALAAETQVNGSLLLAPESISSAAGRLGPDPFPRHGELELYMLSDFMSVDFKQDSLIEGAITEAQSGALSGKPKTNKTTIAAAGVAKAETKESGRLDKERRAVCEVLAKHRECLTRSNLFKLAGVSERRWHLVTQKMLELGDIESCKVTVGNQKTQREGIRLAKAQDA